MSWTIYKLSELCNVFTDGDWIESKDQSLEGIRLLQTGNIGIGVFKERIDKARYVSEETFKRLNCEEVFEGDLLISRLPEPVGRGCLIPNITGRAITAVDCTILRVKSNLVDKRYLEYFIQSQPYQLEVQSKVTGTTRQRISRKNLGEIPIVFPPLSVQKQIVEKLDTAFAHIDKAISATEKNIENAEALFLAALDNLVNEKSLGKKILIGEVCELFQGLAINKKTKHLLVEKSGKPLLRIKDLVNGNHEQYVDDNYFSEATNIEENDLIFTRTGSLGLVFRGRQGVLHNNSFKIVPSSNLIADYFFWWLHNPKFLAEIHKIAQKAAQPDISHKLFKSQSIRVPNKEKQRELVSNIESVYQRKISYSSLMQKKLKLIANLKDSILNQAFSGELTKDAA